MATEAQMIGMNKKTLPADGMALLVICGAVVCVAGTNCHCHNVVSHWTEANSCGIWPEMRAIEVVFGHIRSRGRFFLA
jgi:hypothetical protein